jgi:PST family polysaccharide transporter
MTLWAGPHIVWCVRNTSIAPRDLFLAIFRPLLASLMSGGFAIVLQFHFGQFQSPFLRLFFSGGVMISLYLAILLFAMGQKAFYVDLFRSLRSAT